METFWFIILALMFTVFIVMDGTDFGAGIIHLFLSKNEKDKRSITKAIGPFWDGNEVWLLASGGVMFFAFPILYASSFSGFYLPLIMVLWLLIFRAIGLELRGQVDNDLWRIFWDKAFGISSLVLTLFFGVALGNVVRGVNLGKVENGVSQIGETYFFTPLWNGSFSPFQIQVGVLDWFTIFIGLIAIVVITVHGASWIIFKTNSTLNNQLRIIIRNLSLVILVLIIISVIIWLQIKPGSLDNFIQRPVLYIFPLLMLLSIIKLFLIKKSKKDHSGFIFSSLLIVSSLAATAAAMFPVVLPSSNEINPSLNIYNAATSEYGLRIGVWWWVIGIILTIGYFYFVHRIFKGKLDDIDYH